MTTQYGFFIDSARCTGCKTCELACKDYKNLTPEVSFRRIYEYAEMCIRDRGVRNLAGYNEKIAEAARMGRPIPDPYWKPGDSMDAVHPDVYERQPCLERVRRLERQGFIQGYTALLNPHYLDASLLVFVEITLNRGAPDVFEQFNAAVQKLEEIQECHLVSGDFDYLLKTRVPDMSAYRKLLGETLLRLPGVNDTRTYVVMEEVKQSNRLVIKTR